MAKAASKKADSALTYPSPEQWAEVCDWLTREAKCGQCDMHAVQVAVRQAMKLSVQIREEAAAEPKHGAVLKTAKRIQKLLSNLAHELQGEYSQRALRAIKADDTLARLLSFSAVGEAVPSSCLSERLDLNAVAAFEQQTTFRGQAFDLPALDHHFTRYKKSAIGSATAEIMLHAVQQLQLPFDQWLFVRNIGGRPVETGRRALLYCLIKDYEAIFKRPMDNSYFNRIMSLAVHLFPACGLRTDGLEDATKRALDSFADWSAWSSLEPMLAVHVGPPNEDAPEDDEPPLTSAKPGAKS